MVEFPRRNGMRGWTDVGKHNFCVAIFDNHMGGTVIGASIMRHREVVLDVRSSTITFADADCTKMSPRNALLQSPFNFASCNGKNTSVASPSSLSKIKALL